MMEIGGEPVLSRTLRAFENAACISKIVIVARACDFDAIQKRRRSSQSRSRLPRAARSGRIPFQTVQRFAVTQSISPCTMRRDRLSRRRKSKPCARTRKNTARRRAAPVKDTIKVAAADGTVCATPERSTLRAIQTPQVFRLSLYKKRCALRKRRKAIYGRLPAH